MVAFTCVMHTTIVIRRHKFADWNLLFFSILKGMNILLSADEHILGRTVENPRFRISAVSVSGNHCKIYKDTVIGELQRDEPVPVYLKDSRFLFLLDLALSNNNNFLFLN